MVGAVRNDLALSGGERSLLRRDKFDGLRFDAYRLIGLRPDPYLRLNATDTPMILCAAGPRGPRVKDRLG